MSWKKPPAVVVIGGTQAYLREREVRNALLVSARNGKAVVQAKDLAEAVDAYSAAATFGEASLIVLDAGQAEPSVVEQMISEPAPGSCLLLVVPGALEEKKYPALGLVHAAYQLEHKEPTNKKGRRQLALRFAASEADRLLGEKKTMAPKLIEALVNNVGVDLGVLAFEISKMAALARARGKQEIGLEEVRDMIRGSSDLDLSALREALKARNATRVAAEMDKLRRKAADPPVMLLLRSKGGVSDLAMSWLTCALMLEQGASEVEIAMRLGQPEWAVSRDVVPAAKRWGKKRLRALLTELSRVDRGVLLGSPNPWAALESALLIGVS
jgi:DNA polymerase III delta subunit